MHSNVPSLFPRPLGLDKESRSRIQSLHPRKMPVTLAFVRLLELAKVFISHLRPVHMLIPRPGMFFLLPRSPSYTPNTVSSRVSFSQTSCHTFLLFLTDHHVFFLQHLYHNHSYCLLVRYLYLT